MKHVIRISNNINVAYIKELILNRVKVTGQLIVNTTSDVDEALRFENKETAESAIVTLSPIIQDKLIKLSIEEVEQ